MDVTNKNKKENIFERKRQTRKTHADLQTKIPSLSLSPNADSAFASATTADD